MKTIIRKANLKDLEEILRLNKALFDYETIFNDEYNLDWTYSDTGRSYFKKMIESEITIVAEVDKKIAGYLVASVHISSFRKFNPVAELENMYIDKECRRQGIGKKLVEEMKKEIKARGAKTVKVEAAFQNDSAIKFYKSFGFSEFDVMLLSHLD